MGHSEGGIATAQSDYYGVKGIIISGWTCTNQASGRDIVQIDLEGTENSTF